MSYYIKTKFQIGQDIYSIKDDKIRRVKVESIQITTDKKVAYLANNELFYESQSFSCEEEAKDFMSKAYRVPFLTGNFAWEGNLQGVKRVSIREFGTFWFKEDLKEPFNRQISTHDGNVGCLNSTTTCETQLEATEKSLEMIKNNKK
jgi:hypothetical protein